MGATRAINVRLRYHRYGGTWAHGPDGSDPGHLCSIQAAHVWCYLGAGSLLERPEPSVSGKAAHVCGTWVRVLIRATRAICVQLRQHKYVVLRRGVLIRVTQAICVQLRQ